MNENSNRPSRSKYQKLVSDIAAFALGSGLSKLILFLLLPFYTAVMSSASYGESELIYSALQIVAPFTSLCVTEAVFRYAIDNDEKTGEVFRLGLLITSSSFILMVAVCLFGRFVTGYQYAIDFLILYTVFSYAQLYKNQIRGYGHSRLFAISGVVNAGVVAASSVVLIYGLQMDVRGYVLAFSFGYCAELCTVVAVERNRFPYKGRIPKRTAIEAMKYCLPLIPNIASWWVADAATRYIVSWFMGFGFAGVFAAASKISAAVYIATDVFGKAWQYSASKEISSNDSDYFSQVYSVYQALVFTTTSLIVAVVPVVYPFVFAGDFYEARYYVSFLVVAASINGMSTFFGSFYAAVKNNNMTMVSTLAGAITNVVLNAALIPLCGMAGAVASNTLSFYVIAAIRLSHTRRYVDVGASQFKMLFNILFLLGQAFTQLFFGPIAPCAFFIALLAFNRRQFKLALRMVKGFLIID